MWGWGWDGGGGGGGEGLQFCILNVSLVSSSAGHDERHFGWRLYRVYGEWRTVLYFV